MKDDVKRMRISETEELVEHIAAAFAKCADKQRFVVGIAGAPASGKSTLAEELAKRLRKKPEISTGVVVVPMDGFHLDNAVLDERGQRDVKGAEQTFDVTGFLRLLRELVEPTCGSTSGVRHERVDPIYLPVFDRAMDLSRCAARAVLPSDRLIVVEGNYLLLDRAPWDQLFAQFDLTVMIDVSEAELRRRLSQRWVKLGFDADAVALKVEENDLPNGQAVLHHSRAATFLIASDQ